MATYRLDAINRCLDAIGESPVNSPSSGVPDAEDASRVIDRITREVLEPGWVVNTVETTLQPDLEGVIKIAPNIIKVDTVGRDKRLAVTVRNDVDSIDKLFAIKDQTFIFTAPVLVELVYFFDIDGLPFALQNYIAAKSARVFQESAMGSVSLDNFTVRQEKEALAILQDYEAEQEDSNVLTDSAYMQIVTGRNNHLSGV
jgi:hypothetical protein